MPHRMWWSSIARLSRVLRSHKIIPLLKHSTDPTTDTMLLSLCCSALWKHCGKFLFVAVHWMCLILAVQAHVSLE